LQLENVTACHSSQLGESHRTATILARAARRQKALAEPENYKHYLSTEEDLLWWAEEDRTLAQQ